MTKDKPISEKTRSLCELLSTGPKSMEELRAKMQYVERSNVWKICTRGVASGVVRVDIKDGRKMFSVPPNWLEIVESRKPVQKPEPKRDRSRKPTLYTGPILTRWVGTMSHLNEAHQ